MSEPIWNKFLTERDRAVFGAAGYGTRQGFGKRPALLIVDVNYAFCDERPMPILESIKRWRNSCGEDAWIAMPYLKSLIDKKCKLFEIIGQLGKTKTLSEAQAIVNSDREAARLALVMDAEASA